MADSYVKIDSAALAQLLRSEQGPVVRNLTERGTRVQDRAKQLVGRKSDTLLQSILKRFAQDAKGPAVLVGVFSGPALQYIWPHHQGAASHVIEGNPLLVFFWPKAGKVVAFPRVNHPGNAPNPFLLNALEAAK